MYPVTEKELERAVAKRYFAEEERNTTSERYILGGPKPVCLLDLQFLNEKEMVRPTWWD